MRKLILIAAPLVLAACTQEAAVEDNTAEVEVAEAMTTANGMTPGPATVTGPDGEPLGTTTINADGTYQDVGADGTLAAEGTWEVVDGKTCFTASAEGAEAECWTESEQGEDGSFQATSDAGETVTVTPAAQ